jgi:hypothetical protein
MATKKGRTTNLMIFSLLFFVVGESGIWDMHPGSATLFPNKQKIC